MMPAETEGFWRTRRSMTGFRLRDDNCHRISPVNATPEITHKRTIVGL